MTEMEKVGRAFTKTEKEICPWWNPDKPLTLSQPFHRCKDAKKVLSWRLGQNCIAYSKQAGAELEAWEREKKKRIVHGFSSRALCIFERLLNEEHILSSLGLRYQREIKHDKPLASVLNHRRGELSLFCYLEPHRQRLDKPLLESGCTSAG